MPTDTRPEGCTNFKLRRLSRVVSRHYDAYLAEAGLKSSQYSLLSQIVVHGPMRPTDLAQRMHLDNSTLTRTLHTLEKRGWIRYGIGDDARSHRVEATPAGRERRLLGQRYWKQAQLALNTRLGDSNVNDLHGLLDDFTRTLDATSAE